MPGAVVAGLTDVEPILSRGKLDGSASMSRAKLKSGSSLSGRAGWGERPMSGIGSCSDEWAVK